MKKETDSYPNAVYQSGQRVLISGVYRVAGTESKALTETKEKHVRQLDVGELFPNYEGRAVTWHLEAKAQER